MPLQCMHSSQENGTYYCRLAQSTGGGKTSYQVRDAHRTRYCTKDPEKCPIIQLASDLGGLDAANFTDPHYIKSHQIVLEKIFVKA